MAYQKLSIHFLIFFTAVCLFNQTSNAFQEDELSQSILLVPQDTDMSALRSQDIPALASELERQIEAAETARSSLESYQNQMKTFSVSITKLKLSENANMGYTNAQCAILNSLSLNMGQNLGVDHDAIQAMKHQVLTIATQLKPLSELANTAKSIDKKKEEKLNEKAETALGQLETSRENLSDAAENTNPPNPIVIASATEDLQNADSKMYALSKLLDKTEELIQQFDENHNELKARIATVGSVRGAIVNRIQTQLNGNSWQSAAAALGELATVSEEAGEWLRVNAAKREDIARHALQGIIGLKEKGIASLQAVALNPSTSSKIRDLAVVKLRSLASSTTEQKYKSALLNAGQEISNKLGSQSFYRHQGVVIMRDALKSVTLTEEETKAKASPTSGAPTSGAPASGAPASGAPASGAPASGAPASGSPPVDFGSGTRYNKDARVLVIR